MDPLRENLKSALSFSKREKRGIAVVILIMCLIWKLPDIISIFSQPEDENLIRHSYLAFTQGATHEKNDQNTGIGINEINELFDFDPNSVSVKDMKRLGIPSFLAERIDNYRVKGGLFRKNEDLLRIYGMKEEIFERIKPYIVLPKINQPILNERKASENSPIELNTADSLSLIDLPGIGPVLTNRILAYRNSLGGFAEMSQLLEVYGISDSLYRVLKSRIYLSEPTVLNKIPINQINQKELAKHPYFRKSARVIVSYRQAHGAFHSTEDMTPIQILNDSIVDKISPYLDFQ